MSGDGGVGASPRRTDGPAKVTGAFAYASDLAVDGMLDGATLRSPHAAARIRAIDTTAAQALPGVHAVLTAADLPGARRVGMIVADQPVLCDGETRCNGDPVAIVAAEDLATARRACGLIAVDYEPVAAVASSDAALADGARVIDPEFGPGNVVRRVRIVHGDPGLSGPVVVRGTYAVDSQDQAFLGPEAGVAIPAGDGVELHVATQWLHGDHEQIAAGLGLPADRVHLVLAGVGGAFGGREDLSMQLHACLLALKTRRPVRMVYAREESFVGHVHRHPARMTYEHHATADGRIVCVRCSLAYDGGAYASSSSAVILNAATVAAGPYEVPNALIEGVVVYTNNPPNGAMRGFGAVQVAIAYEAQMDRLAAAVGLDPLELRARNAMREGTVMPTGQAIEGPAAVDETIEALRALPDPPPRRDDWRALPGGAFQATRGEDVRRGVGYALGYKNVAFSEGFDDSSAARVSFVVVDGEPTALVHTAAAEVGQGVVGVQEQIARTELGVAAVAVLDADTAIGSAGSASASRLTWMIGGAVKAACEQVRAHVLVAASAVLGVAPDALALRDGHVVARGDGVPALAIADVLARTGTITAEHTYRHRKTTQLDPETGQGEPHAGFAFCGHRAVVEVDTELGLARVVELTCVEDVGRAINPLALEGQLEGASIQGLGLALTEAMAMQDGLVLSRSFGSYRIPTFADAAPVPTVILELSDPATPYGVKGVGELASLSSTPAVLAALRDATGCEVVRAPARPEDLVAR